MYDDRWARIPSLWKEELLRLSIEKPPGIFVNPHPLCQHCGEPVLPHEPRGQVVNAIMHHECFFRSVAGSVGHQQKNCHCYGKTDTSELGMSKRDAARRSLAFYRSQHEGISR